MKSLQSKINSPQNLVVLVNYSSEIQTVRESLHQHQQQTINVTRAGHEYENFIMGQKKRKHQIVKMKNLKGSLQKGDGATMATAEQFEHKFKSANAGPLGQGAQTPQDLEFLQIIKDSALTEKSREDSKIKVHDPIFETEFVKALRTMHNRKRAGVDEEMVELYKLIFNIKKPENPENWTDLERHYQQTLAALELNRKTMVAQILVDVNRYISLIAQNNWRDNDSIIQILTSQCLLDLHHRMHIGDIVGVPKNNGKDECTMEAWRPIYVLEYNS